MNKNINFMKMPKWIVSGLCAAVMTGVALAQQPLPSPPRPLPPIPAPAPEKKGLTTFDLDFPGGTPRDLVAAIQKAMGRPLNAIVPDQFADTKLPALTLRGVDVNQLFKSIELSSRKNEAVTSGNYPGLGGYQNYQIQTTYYGFRTDGPMNDDAIWYFYVEKPAMPLVKPVSQTVCKFYSLAPYLERGLTVDDITTAIKTGWKMLGDTSTPTISFHKETKLLIAVGEPAKLETIDSVLTALNPGVPAGPKPVPPVPPAVKPGTVR